MRRKLIFIPLLVLMIILTSCGSKNEDKKALIDLTDNYIKAVKEENKEEILKLNGSNKSLDLGDYKSKIEDLLALSKYKDQEKYDEFLKYSDEVYKKVLDFDYEILDDIKKEDDLYIINLKIKTIDTEEFKKMENSEDFSALAKLLAGKENTKIDNIQLKAKKYKNKDKFIIEDYSELFNILASEYSDLLASK
jgi:hypothetical protein